MGVGKVHRIGISERIGSQDPSRLKPLFSAVDDATSCARQALEASGISRWEAFGLVAMALGSEDARDEWGRFLGGKPGCYEVWDALNGIAESAPDLADMFFHEHYAGRHIRGRLDCGKAWPRIIPEGMSVEETLGLEGCRVLERIGVGMKVGGSLSMRDCIAIAKLPERLEVGVDLISFGCVRLESVGFGTAIGRDLFLAHNGSFKEFPKGLVIGRDLKICECPTFRRLPMALQVGRDLKIESCPNWDGVIPDDMKVGGHVFHDGVCYRT
jgi:hypothetical protein